MNKQEQIEEMAVIGCVRNPQAHTAEECSKCDFKQGMCNAYRHAEALYNAGYRKIPENAVVLTKEEYIDLSRNYVTEQIEKTRKETAKEILQKMKEKCKELENKFSHICKSQKECLMETCRYEGVLAVKREVYELAKEYGVEVEQ